LAAGRVDGQHLIELNEACRSVIDVADSDDAAAFLHANTNLHAAVAAATGNALMARFVRILYERLQRVLYASGRFDEIVAKVAHHHDELVELLIENRGDDVEIVVTRQIQHNHQIMLSELSEYGAGFSSSPIGPVVRGEGAKYG
jgi:DNA-binding GntR family transcriptional regulator